MKHSDDIVNLFQQFGAKADPYQELARKQEHKLSSERWPLVSAVRDAVGDDVPAVDRRAGAVPAAAPQAVPAAPARPEPAGWVQRAAPVAAEIIPSPAVAAVRAPVPAPVPAPAPAPVPAADHRLPSTALSSRSPLAGLAGLRSAASPSTGDGHAQGALPVDLPSVFARLSGASAPAEIQPVPAPAWQPRKGHP